MKGSDCAGLESSGKTVVSYDSSNTGQIVDGGFSHCIEHSHSAVRCDCGSIITPGPVTEEFAIPDETVVSTKGYRAEDTHERNVQVDFYITSIELRLSLKRIFLTEDARNLARRLNRVADVEVGETERRP